jgi:hypothetical protein
MFSAENIFLKNTSLKIFYDGNHFTPEQTEHKLKVFEFYGKHCKSDGCSWG